jgi:hypothetical protein
MIKKESGIELFFILASYQLDDVNDGGILLNRLSAINSFCEITLN